MLLAIDMGNTQTAMGLFDGDELVQSWRMPTDRSYTADEIHVRLMGFFKMYGLSLDAVDAIAFAGVVPQLSREWHAVADRIAADAIVIGPQTAPVISCAARPQAVGADRVANAVAAETFYGAPAIVVDFGTATNIDVIDEDGFITLVERLRRASAFRWTRSPPEPPSSPAFRSRRPSTPSAAIPRVHQGRRRNGRRRHG